MALIGCRIVTRHQFKTDEWLDDIRAHGCTTTALVGAMGRFVMQSPERPDDADNPLELVQMGPVLPNVEEFQSRFGIAEVTAAYAMTEIPYAFVTNDPHVVTNATSRSCGIRDMSVPIRVVDANGRDVGPGEIGELLVGGDRRFVNSGYYKMPEESARAWEDGWFHTGDLFRFDEEGRYYFVDRAKDALRRRGENISSIEIEALINRHPAVSESAVIGVPSEFSEDEVKVFIVLEPGQQLGPEELIKYIRPQIAEFAVPRYVEFTDSLPKTATQRVQKVLLRERGITPDTWDRLQGKERVRTRATERKKG
jgi:crotonobetaine/carnitine-CoA ligase